MKIVSKDLVARAKAKANEANGTTSREVVPQFFSKEKFDAQNTRQEWADLRADEKRKWNFGFSAEVQRLLRRAVPLSPEEEKILLERMINCWDIQAYREICMRNARLVAMVVWRYRYFARHLSLEDLFQEGWIGLQKACWRFDLSRGVRFSTYATWWVKHEIARIVQNQRQTIRVPVHMQERIRKIILFQRDYWKVAAQNPTTREIAKGTGLSPRMVEAALRVMMYDDVSIDTGVGGSGYDLQTKLPDERIAEPGALKIDPKTILGIDLLGRIAELDPFRRETILLRLDGWTLQEVGNRYGTTRERARQKQKEAVSLAQKIACRKRELSEKEIAYLRNVVAVTLGAEKSERVFEWGAFREYINAIEGRPSKAIVAALFCKKCITKEHEAISSHFWAVHDEQAFAMRLKADRIYKATLRDSLKSALRTAWLANQARFGVIDMAVPAREERPRQTLRVVSSSALAETAPLAFRALDHALRLIENDLPALASSDSGALMERLALLGKRLRQLRVEFKQNREHGVVAMERLKGVKNSVRALQNRATKK